MPAFGWIDAVQLHDLIAIEIEHEEADSGRQVAKLASGVDRGDEVRQARIALAGNLLEPRPERVLEADARLVAGNDDGAFDHQGFHRSSPISYVVMVVSLGLPGGSQSAMMARGDYEVADRADVSGITKGRILPGCAGT